MAETSPPGQRRERILVINDDTTFLALMEELLEEIRDYEVETCKAWENAYGRVKEIMPDLVVLDIVMDHQERGWTILELLTLDPRTRPIPVIVCSAAISSLHAHQALLEQYGVEALPKPFDLEALLQRIEVTLTKYPRVSSPGSALQT